MDLEIVILKEVSKTKEKYHMASIICEIEKEIIEMNLQKRKRLTDLEKKLMAMGAAGGKE